MKRYVVSAPAKFGLTKRFELATDPESAKLQASEYWSKAGDKQHLSLNDRVHFLGRLSCERSGIFRCCDSEWDGPGGQLVTTCEHCGRQSLATDAQVEEVIESLLADDFVESLTTLGVFEVVEQLDPTGIDFLIGQDRWGLLERVGTLNLLIPVLRDAEPSQIVRLHALPDARARTFAIRVHGSK